MQKVISHSGGNSHNINFRANRTAHTVPEIEESYVDDEGNIQHILSNGNTLSDVYLVKIWGQPKGIVKPKGHKGDTIGHSY